MINTELQELFELTTKLQASLEENNLEVFDSLQEKQKFNLQICKLQRGIIKQAVTFTSEDFYKQEILSLVGEIDEGAFNYIINHSKKHKNFFASLANFNSFVLGTLKDRLTYSKFDKFVALTVKKKTELLDNI
jgi:hypothetical protein